jgi:hypothetical protein
MIKLTNQPYRRLRPESSQRRVSSRLKFGHALAPLCPQTARQVRASRDPVQVSLLRFGRVLAQSLLPLNILAETQQFGVANAERRSFGSSRSRSHLLHPRALGQSGWGRCLVGVRPPVCELGHTSSKVRRQAKNWPSQLPPAAMRCRRHRTTHQQPRQMLLILRSSARSSGSRRSDSADLISEDDTWGVFAGFAAL